MRSPMGRLEYERRMRGMTTTELGKAIGYSVTMISRIERGHQKSYPKFRRKCAEFFGIPEKELFPDA